MTHALSNSEHKRWGLPINSYPKLYTEDAIAAQTQTSLDLAEDWRSVAITTISDICKLDQYAHQNHLVETTATRITLQMLKSVLELTRFPSEFENFALPSLVAGSMVLMSSVQPTPFSYEYGYLCFRILVFSLNTCLIRHGRNLSFTIRRMSSAPSGAHLDFFWDGAADLIAGELSDVVREKRLTHVLDPGPQQIPLLSRPKLDTLLKLLHKDQKNFLIVLMTADSLQLSGLMFVMWKYLESEQKSRNKTDYTQKLFLPYSRIFRRYRLVFPDTNHEAQLMTLIYVNLPDISDLQDKATVDLEDSRNIIHAYNRSLKSSQTLSCKDAIHYMGFVGPLFVPGCENLVPCLLDSTFWVLWNNINSDTDQLATVVQGYGVCFWYLFNDQLKPSRSNHESWRFELVDVIMQSDVLELIFQVALKLLASQTYNLKHRIKELFNTMTSFWEKTVDYVPREYFEQRMMESGAIDSWFRYFVDFRERLDPRASSAIQDIMLPFSMIFSRAVTAILGNKWRNIQFGFQVTGMCDNPRCPYPTNTSTGCSKCMKATYCSPRCLAKDWSSHAPVCGVGSDVIRH